MRAEHRLRVSEYRVLRIFGPERDEVTVDWRKLHNEELNDLGRGVVMQKEPVTRFTHARSNTSNSV